METYQRLRWLGRKKFFLRTEDEKASNEKEMGISLFLNSPPSPYIPISIDRSLYWNWKS